MYILRFDDTDKASEWDMVKTNTDGIPVIIKKFILKNRTKNE